LNRAFWKGAILQPLEAESLQSVRVLPHELTRSRQDGARQEEASAATLLLERAVPGQPSSPTDRGKGRPTDIKRQSRSLLRRRPVVSAIVALLLASIIGAGYVYVDYIRHFESTDDAFIAARQSSLAPKVSGYITAVPVTDNEHVAPAM
jgi:membrane fusion protein, multidrug efflux system